jgi:hypothetical protein
VRKIFLAVAVLFAAVLFTGSTAHALLDVEARYWYTNLDDSIRFSNGSIAGTDINLVNDLGVDDKKGFAEGRITLELGSHKLRYGFMPMQWKGSKTLNQSIVFNGQTYTASTNVDTKAAVDYHRLGYEYDIIDLLDNRLGLIFELKYFDVDARLTSTGLNEKGTLRAPIPTIGVAGQVGLPFLINVGGEITGISAGKNIYLVDAEAAINIKPAPFVVISGGYRIFKLHADKNSDLVDITLRGPFISLKADF